MNSTEATARMISVLEKAEAAADNGLQIKGELYIKIADQWQDVVWVVADAENKAMRAAEKPAKALAGDESDDVMAAKAAKLGLSYEAETEKSEG